MARAEESLGGRRRRDDSSFYRACGVLGLLGVAAAVIADLIGVWVHDTTGFVADTISALAAGRWSWIQDWGLYALAAGILAVAVGLHRWRLDGWRWQAGASLLDLVALTVFVIAFRNQYGDGSPAGVVVHIYLVYILGVVFAAVSLLTAGGFDNIEHGWSRFSLILAGLWIVAAPVFFFVPDGWDGLYERAVAGLMLLWIVIVSHLLIRHARGDFERENARG